MKTTSISTVTLVMLRSACLGLHQLMLIAIAHTGPGEATVLGSVLLSGSVRSWAQLLHHRMSQAISPQCGQQRWNVFSIVLGMPSRYG